IVSSAADKGALWVIDMAVGKKIKTIDGLGHAVTGIALNKNGDIFIWLTGMVRLLTWMPVAMK
ncbi:hypothetical protein PRR79_28615, partial [Klebsiella pneumoniae]|nr:hypothetical protein [Klebsiella pneumoniae]